MELSYKNVSVGGVTKVEDEGKGVVTAYVSVTGIEDNVKDVILPGAYTDTLKARMPKGAWGHDWKTPTAKTLDITELKPGHKDLPKTLSNGQAWPKDAGALRVKMKFNLGSSRGRDAYSDVMFFKDEQEWSIGYSVPKDGFYKKDGVRYIKKLDLYEYSPVLFGAMTHARTASVKDAQFGMKMLNGATAEEVKGWEAELVAFKKAIGVEISEGTDSTDLDDEADVEEDEFYEDGEDEGADQSKVALTPDLIRENIVMLEKMLVAMGEPINFKDGVDIMEAAAIGQQAYIEAKATSAVSLMDTTLDVQSLLSKDDWNALQVAADAFDEANEDDDYEALEKAASDVLDLVEKGLAEVPEDDVDPLHVVATVVADIMHDMDTEADGHDSGKHYMVRGTEYKQFHFASGNRAFGTVQHNGRLACGSAPTRAYVKMLDDEPLMALKDYIDSMDPVDFIDASIKTIADRECAKRGIKGSGGDCGPDDHPMEDAGKKKKTPRRKGRRRDEYEQEEDAMKAEQKTVTLDLDEFKELGIKF